MGSSASRAAASTQWDRFKQTGAGSDAVSRYIPSQIDEHRSSSRHNKRHHSAPVSSERFSAPHSHMDIKWPGRFVLTLSLLLLPLLLNAITTHSFDSPFVDRRQSILSCLLLTSLQFTPLANIERKPSCFALRSHTSCTRSFASLLISVAP